MHARQRNNLSVGIAHISCNQKEHFGLGLYIAQEIVTLHKGKLMVGDAAGGGAVFSLTLLLKLGDILLPDL